MKKSNVNTKILPWLTAVIAALFSLNAGAIIIEAHDSLEIKASAVTLPSTDGGRVSVKRCDQCDAIKLNTDRNTTLYEIHTIDGQATRVNLQQFAAEMRLIDNSDALVLIIYQLDNQTIAQARLYSEATPRNPGRRNSNNKSGNKNAPATTQRSW